MSKYQVGDEVIIVVGAPQWYNKASYPDWAQMEADINWAEAKLWYPEATKRLPKEKPDHIFAEDDIVWHVDMKPQWQGKKGIILEVSEVQDFVNYVIDIEGVGRVAWFRDYQIKKPVE